MKVVVLAGRDLRLVAVQLDDFFAVLDFVTRK
jgi:hypothetical protein